MTERVDGGGGAAPTSPPPAPSYAGLLTDLMTHTLDADYAVAAARRRAAGDAAGAAGGPETAGAGGGKPRRTLSNRAGVVVAVTVFGVLLGVSALKTSQDQPQATAERAELIEQIEARQSALDGLHAELSALEGGVGGLQQALANQAEATSRLTADLRDLGVTAGTVAVSGPGMVITLDNARHAIPGAGGVILDSDLQALVNGLWVAGAEAIAIDGHRLTALTSIRLAGRAITVDYRSLTPPYVVEAIGDPATLPSRLLETQGGQLWLGLRANYGITFETQTQGTVTMPGDTHGDLLWAEPAGSR